MSLNQLALSMWEKMGFGSVDASVLSRVLRGERLFTLDQLRTFSEILKLSTGDSERLKVLLVCEINNRLGLDPELLFGRSSNFVERIEVAIGKIKLANKRGISFLADDNFMQFDEILRREIKFGGLYSRSKLIRLRAKLLIEGGFLNFISKKKDDLLRSTEKVYSRLNYLGTVIKDDEVLSMGKFLMADANYINGNFDSCLQYIPNPKNNAVPSREFLWGLRTLSITLARLHREQEYDAIRKMILKNHLKYSEKFDCNYFEGFARASTELGRRREAYKYLDLAYKYLDISPNISRVVQVINTEVEMGIKFDQRLYDTEKKAREGYTLAVKIGHKRYQNRLKNYLEKGVYN